MCQPLDSKQGTSFLPALIIHTPQTLGCRARRTSNRLESWSNHDISRGRPSTNPLRKDSLLPTSMPLHTPYDRQDQYPPDHHSNEPQEKQFHPSNTPSPSAVQQSSQSKWLSQLFWQIHAWFTMEWWTNTDHPLPNFNNDQHSKLASMLKIFISIVLGYLLFTSPQARRITGQLLRNAAEVISSETKPALNNYNTKMDNRKFRTEDPYTQWKSTCWSSQRIGLEDLLHWC